MIELNIRMTVEEANAILTTLGELPTKAGVYPLLVKIKQQAEAQMSEKNNDS